jgi:hypothetical protein
MNMFSEVFLVQTQKDFVKHVPKFIFKAKNKGKIGISKKKKSPGGGGREKLNSKVN